MLNAADAEWTRFGATARWCALKAKAQACERWARDLTHLQRVVAQANADMENQLGIARGAVRPTGALPIKGVSVRPIRADFAFVDLRIPGLVLHGIKGTRDTTGGVVLKCPTRVDRHGREWPLFSSQRGLTDDAAHAVADIWTQVDRSTQGGGERSS
jgi:ketosteroid isomerase-like protein